MTLRLRLIIILIGAVLVVATFTFPIWQPLLERNVVEDTLPGLTTAQQSAFDALPADQQTAFGELTATDTAMGSAVISAALTAPRAVPENEQALPDVQGAELILDGSNFRAIDAVRWATGTMDIYELPDSTKLLRFEDFEVANGPDLRVVLSASEQPLTSEEVQLNNIDLELGLLKGTLGSQNYQIPAQVDLSQYNSVVIYSRSYGVVFSSAPI